MVDFRLGFEMSVGTKKSVKYDCSCIPVLFDY